MPSGSLASPALPCPWSGDPWGVPLGAVTGLCVCFYELVSVCSGIGRGERGLCFTVSTLLVTDVGIIGWAWLLVLQGHSTCGQLCRDHSVEAPHLSRSRNPNILHNFQKSSLLCPFPALRFVFAICAESLKLQSTLSADNEWLPLRTITRISLYSHLSFNIVIFNLAILVIDRWSPTVFILPDY